MHVVDFKELTSRVRSARDAAIVAVAPDDPCGRDLADILKAMWDTHGSMLSIYKAAERIEQECGLKTGRWMDALLLARPQYDALFIALLLAHDYKTYGPEYRRAGWAAEARRTFYVRRRYREVHELRSFHSKNLRRLKEWARGLKIIARQWRATLADVRGRMPANQSDLIKPLPMPGAIIKADGSTLLAGGPYETLGCLLWQQWKFLCDPAHIGVSLLVFKGGLRGDDDTIKEEERQSAIDGRVVAGAIHPSFVAIMTLATIVALRYAGNVELRARVVKGWEDLDRGTLEGHIIWDGWAREALGVLAS